MLDGIQSSCLSRALFDWLRLDFEAIQYEYSDIFCWMDGWIDEGVMREVETQYERKGQREELLLRGCKKDEVNWGEERKKRRAEAP